MRLAYVCADPGVPVFGSKGCSVHVREVVNALRRRGAMVDLFACRYDGPMPASWNDVTCHELPRPPKGDAAVRERQSMEANLPLAATLLDAGPFDAVYERYSLWSSAGMAHAARCGIPGILEVNAPLIDEQATHRNLVHRIEAERIAADVFTTASTVVAVSDGVADYVRSVAPSAQVCVIGNGVDHRRFTPAAHRDTAVPVGRFVVGFAGTMKPWHGLELLLEAYRRFARECDDAHLLLVGEGPLRAGLAEHLDRIGLARAATFTGAVDAERMPSLLAAMDVATAPYPARDDFYFSPLKVVEYMASGRPVVASAIGSILSVIEDGVSGLLHPPGDIAAMVRLFGRLHRDHGLRTRLGAAARAGVLARHTWDHVAGQILELMGDVPASTTAEGAI